MPTELPIAGRGVDEIVVDPLMTPLSIVVLEEARDGAVQGSLAEESEVAEALILDGLHPALRVGIAVWSTRRDAYGFNLVVLQDGTELVGEFRVAIDDEVRDATKEGVVEGNEVEPRLLHEDAVGMRPTTCTRRELMSMTKSVYTVTRPFSVQTSVVKKSAAASVSQWDLMKRDHEVFVDRSGAGSIPLSLRTPLDRVVGDDVAYVLEGSWIRRYPQVGFSFAILTMRSAVSFMTPGAATTAGGGVGPLPGDELRCQRRIVSGVTIVAT